MTQRNPMNERYTREDGVKGKSRKSAASAKPATKAAASVYIEPAKKQPQKKGFLQSLMGGGNNNNAGKDANKAKQPDVVTKADYFNPPTERYKKLRRLWWVLLGIAIVFTVLSFIINSSGITGPISIATLVIAYGAIIGALYLDFGKIRKERTRYQEEQERLKTKVAKRERKERLAQLEAERAEAERQAAEKAAEKEARKEKFKSFFGGKKDDDGDMSEKDIEDDAKDAAQDSK